MFLLHWAWEISDTSLISISGYQFKVSIEGNSLCISVHYKPTDSHSYLHVHVLHSSSHPSHVKNSIPYSLFLKLHGLCSKLLQNDPDTGRIFSQPPLISFTRHKNIGTFLVRSAFHTSDQPGG